MMALVRPFTLNFTEPMVFLLNLYSEWPRSWYTEVLTDSDSRADLWSALCLVRIICK